MSRRPNTLPSQDRKHGGQSDRRTCPCRSASNPVRLIFSGEPCCIVPCVVDAVNGPNLRCTTLRLPSSIRTLALRLGQHHDDRGGAGHTHHGGRWHVHAPGSFGRAFSISLITALVGGPGVYGCFGKSSGRLQETGGRVGRPSDRPWLAENGGGGRACCGFSGYPALAPYDAKKSLCGKSWRLTLTFVNLGCI